MTTFIMTGKYSAESLKEVSLQRNAEASEIFKQSGGKIRSVFATMGGTDLLVIADLPGVAEAFEVSVNLTRSFGILFSTVPALPIEDFDRLVSR